jgi:hypothetical protein
VEVLPPQYCTSPTHEPLLRFRIRVVFHFLAYDLDALKTPGAVLLVLSHCSWLDWLLIWVC